MVDRFFVIIKQLRFNWLVITIIISHLQNPTIRPNTLLNLNENAQQFIRHFKYSKKNTFNLSNYSAFPFVLFNCKSKKKKKHRRKLFQHPHVINILRNA